MSDEAHGSPEDTNPAGDPLGLRMKRALAAHMRHELRTPINAIIGYSELLIEDAGDFGHQAFVPDLEKIRAAGHELLALVNDLLDADTLETSAELDLEEVGVGIRHALRTPISAVVGYCEMLIEDAEGQHANDLVPDLGQIRTAGKRLLDLMSDLVRLSAVAAGQAEADVTDEGDAVEIAQVMSAIQPLATTHDEIRTDGGGRLLVVDDNAINRDLLTRRLRRDGHRVATAPDGVKALEAVRAADFDLVLLDIVMPEMNGYQVLREMKADPALRYIPVIMLSSLDEVDAVVRCIEMGADDYLSKPFNPVLLKARIDACLEKKRLRDGEQAYIEQLRIERAKSERLLLNILPGPVAELLKQRDGVIADSFPEATVLFADLVGFTAMSAAIPARDLVDFLNEVFSCFDRLAEHHGIEKIKTIGDAYMAVGGLPTPRADHASAMAAMALDMIDEIQLVAERTGRPVQVRIGLNSGPVVAGVIGESKFIYDLWGDTVNTASRMESHGCPGMIHVSQATRERLQDGFVLEAREPIQVKGKGEMQTWFLRGRMGA